MFKKFLMSAAAVLLLNAVHAQSLVKPGDKIAFLGSNITMYGSSAPGGFIRLVYSGLAANGIKIVFIPAGVYAQRTEHLLARMDQAVIAKKPQFMVLCTGMTDVRAGRNGLPMDKFKECVTAIVDKAQAQGIKVCLMTDTIIYEDLSKAYPARLNKQLIERYDFLRVLAKEKGCLFADPFTDIRKAIADYKARYPGVKGNLLTIDDGVHLNAIGERIIARDLLRVFGLNDEQLAKAEAAWKKEGRRAQIATVTLSAAELDAVMKKAAEKKMRVTEYIASLVEKDVNSGK